MTDKKEIEVHYSPEVQAKIDADPELAEAMREMGAVFRQAMPDCTFSAVAEFRIAFPPSDITLGQGLGACKTHRELIGIHAHLTDEIRSFVVGHCERTGKAVPDFSKAHLEWMAVKVR